MRLLTTTFLALALISGQVFAEWYDTRTHKPAPDTEWRKSSGALGAALLLTGEPEAFFKEWTETPESNMPIVKSITKVKRGDIVTALVVFYGCGSSAPNCDALIDFKVLKPDGSVYGDVPGNPAWSGPSPTAGIVVLSNAHLQIRIEPKDPLGSYQVLAVMKDPSTKTAISLKQRFQVVK